MDPERNVKERLDMKVEVKKNGEYCIVPCPDILSFDEGFFCSVKAVKLLREKMDRVIIVGIAGPSGAGKTSLAKKIRGVIPKSLIISMDNYLDPQSAGGIIDENYDDYRLIDFNLLAKNVIELKSGNPTDTPVYDFKISGRSGYVTMQPPPSRVVIVEGTYGLYQKIRPHLDLHISISGGIHYDLIKRVFRDTQRTGQEPNESIKQITETVYPMYKAFIEPDLQNAHIRIRNRFNPFSGLLAPVYSLKSLFIPDDRSLLEGIRKMSGNDKEVKEMVEEYHDIYLHPPDVAAAECRDWIRMRNNKGKYRITFAEEMREAGFIISPRVDFVVSVKTLGGLMALGYQMGTSINRTSRKFVCGSTIVSVDRLQQLGKTFCQVKGLDRKAVEQVAIGLGLTNFIPDSYIKIYQDTLMSKVTPSPAIPMEKHDVPALSSLSNSPSLSTTGGFPQSPAEKPMELVSRFSPLLSETESTATAEHTTQPPPPISTQQAQNQHPNSSQAPRDNVQPVPQFTSPDHPSSQYQTTPQGNTSTVTPSSTKIETIQKAPQFSSQTAPLNAFGYKSAPIRQAPIFPSHSMHQTTPSIPLVLPNSSIDLPGQISELFLHRTNGAVRSAKL